MQIVFKVGPSQQMPVMIWHVVIIYFTVNFNTVPVALSVIKFRCGTVTDFTS